MAKNVLIAGASRGIGLEIAKCYASAGAHVIATVRDSSRAAELKALGIEVLPLDVGSAASARDLAKTLADRPLNLLICNAGVCIGRGNITDPEYSAESFDVTMRTNVFGVFNVIRECLRPLKAAVRSEHGSRVAVISSSLGSSTTVGTFLAYSYCASKAAATNLTQNLAAELIKDGIVAGAFHPGWVRTDMGGDEADVSAAESAKGLVARFSEMTGARSRSVYSYSGEIVPP